MKVSELIEILQTFDPEKEIVIWYDQWQKQEPYFGLFEEEGNESFYAHIAI